MLIRVQRESLDAGWKMTGFSCDPTLEDDCVEWEHFVPQVAENLKNTELLPGVLTVVAPSGRTIDLSLADPPRQAYFGVVAQYATDGHGERLRMPAASLREFADQMYDDFELDENKDIVQEHYPTADSIYHKPVLNSAREHERNGYWTIEAEPDDAGPNRLGYGETEDEAWAFAADMVMNEVGGDEDFDLADHE